ncbi:MAG: hypothetical protein J6X07_08790 [Prevotella sp.]|nr:hypothetical protein [Prevotella sp.]
MAYNYKKEFFRDWYEKNKKSIRKEDLKIVLKTSSANNLQYWLLEKPLPPLKEGQPDTGDRDWLPLRCILRLCNHYGLRLSDFIENAEEPRQRKRQTKSETKTLAAVKEAYQAALDAKEEALTAKDETIAAQRETIAALQTALGRKGGAPAFAGEKTPAT